MNNPDIMDTEKKIILPHNKKLLNSHDGAPSGRMFKVVAGRVTTKILQKYDVQNTQALQTDEVYQCNYHVATVASLSVKQAMNVLHVSKNHTSKKLAPQQLKTEDLHLENMLDGTLNPIVAHLNYPLSKICEIKIRSSRLMYGRIVNGKFQPHSHKYDNTVGYILNMIAKQYVKIYKTAESRKEYGVWGHELSDLYFEIVSFNPKTREFFVGIGS